MFLFLMIYKFITTSIRLETSTLVALVLSLLVHGQMRLHVPLHIARLCRSKLALRIMNTF